MSSSNFRDLFPNFTIDSLENTHSVRDRTEFQLLAVKKRVLAFKVCILNDRVVMHLLKDEWDRLIFANYIDNAIHSSSLMKFDPSKFVWENFVKRLSKSPFHGNRKNSDVRTCYRVDRNTFIVKPYFTFGQRTVEKGTVHFVQTTVAPMMIYRLDAERRTHRVPVRKESCFLERDEPCYEKFFLQPNRLYEIPSKTVYVLCAVQKTTFSIHVALRNGGVARGESPFALRKFVENPYLSVPETPVPVREESSAAVPPKYLGAIVSGSPENCCMEERPPPPLRREEEEFVAMPPPPVMIREEDLMNWQQQQQQPSIIFVVNPTRLQRGAYDFPKPEDPPLWKLLDETLFSSNGNPSSSSSDDECSEPLDLTTRKREVTVEDLLSMPQIRLEEYAEVRREFKDLLDQMEMEFS